MVVTRTDIYSNEGFVTYNVTIDDLYSNEFPIASSGTLPMFPIKKIVFNGLPENYTVTTKWSDFNTTQMPTRVPLTDATAVLGEGGFNASLENVNDRLNNFDKLLLDLTKEDTTTTLADYNREIELAKLRNESAADYRATQLERDQGYLDNARNRDDNLLARAKDDNDTNETNLKNALDAIPKAPSGTGTGGSGGSGTPFAEGIFTKVKEMILFIFKISLLVSLIVGGLMVGYYCYEKFGLKCEHPEFMPRGIQSLLGLEISTKEDACRKPKQ